MVMSVKPQQFSDLAEEIKDALTENQVVISTITGVPFRDIESFFGRIAMVRIMR